MSLFVKSIFAVLLTLLLCAGEKSIAAEDNIFAADFTLTEIGSEGGFQLSGTRGKVVMLVFLATWCPSCMGEIESLSQLQRQFGKRGLQVVLVAADDSAELLGEFKEERATDLTLLHDRGAKTAKLYSVMMLPTAFILDRQGAIREKILGPRDWQKERFAQGFVSLLDENVVPPAASATEGDRP